MSGRLLSTFRVVPPTLWRHLGNELGIDAPEIASLRAYFQALDAKFPYWFHVCTRLEHSLRMIFMMLVDLKPVTATGTPGVVSYQFSHDDLHVFLLQRLEAMNSLHARHGFSETENLRITELVMNYFASVIAS